MSTLEEYLSGEYHDDMDDIRSLERALKDVCEVFVKSCVGGQWPYEVRLGSLPSPSKSHGTQAMILAALGKATGFCSMATARPANSGLGDKRVARINAVAHSGAKALLELLHAKGFVNSNSFGKNDPITLSHIAELLRGIGDQKLLGCEPEYGPDKATIKGITSFVEDSEALKELRRLAADDPDSLDKLIPNLDPGSQYLRNAFVPLRIVRGCSDLGIRPFHQGYRRFFESSLHAQLSFSAIPDSRFDPSELIFCLEGLLICAQSAVDEPLLRRILDVLGEKQRENANWRPNKPMFATPQGMTMLPVSVEGAISLMRSVAILDGKSDYQPLGVIAVPMMRRFWRWLVARSVQFEGQMGWHSEHVNDPTLIQLWDTSQVVEFMLAFRELLERSIAGRTLLLSRLTVSMSPAGSDPQWWDCWKTKYRNFEPNPAGPRPMRIYRRIYEDFVKPWGHGKPRNFSMLLYGPPGTGKSTVAANIAEALGFRMITVTVSDFLGRGGENVEARAKAIFQTLEAQRDSVILFDEIDSFLLDRDSKLYRDQDTLFQFIAPGMLTKINDLRAKKRSIFIIATNYANRIDPAIKRKGRIDKQYLLSLPYMERRFRIIEQLANLKLVKKNDIAQLSLFFGFSDLRGVVVDAGGKSANEDIILAGLKTNEPATSLRSYVRRHDEEVYPFDELFTLLEMEKETGKASELKSEVDLLDTKPRQAFNSKLVKANPSTKIVAK